MRTDFQKTLRIYLRAREDFQAMRIRMDNRLGLKSDGNNQQLVEDRLFGEKDKENFKELSQACLEQEKQIEKMLNIALKTYPFYKDWLSKVKGVGTITAGYILAEFDIEEATTVSKMRQYSGLNPGLIPGKKKIEAKKFKEGMGEPLYKESYKDKEYIVFRSSQMIRGDRPLSGFILPYNKNLKVVLMGILASSFIKSKSKYRKFYDDYKNRLANEDRLIENSNPKDQPRKDDGKTWKEVSKGHRDFAARRYMIKQFLTDLYVAWREYEGLPVRKPYAEEYLGKKHGGLHGKVIAFKQVNRPKKTTNVKRVINEKKTRKVK